MTKQAGTNHTALNEEVFVQMLSQRPHKRSPLTLVFIAVNTSTYYTFIINMFELVQDMKAMMFVFLVTLILYQICKFTFSWRIH